MAQNSKTAVADKPDKPHPDFPLFPHATRRWAKKVNGKFHYFGPWDKPDEALSEWLRVKDDLLAGRKPRPAGGGFTIRDLVNRYLTHKRHLLDTRELSPRTFGDCYKVCERIIEAFGKNRLVSDVRGDDFEELRASMGKTLGALALGIEIQRIKSVFKYGFDADLMEAPVRYGKGFDKPKASVVAKAKQENGQRMLEAGEIRALLQKTDGPLKAMILLACNCALGNHDVALLPLKALDLDKGWLDFPRPKTGAPRRCPLWPETVKAIQEWMRFRPQPADAADEDVVFLTRFGARWVRKRTAATVKPAETVGGGAPEEEEKQEPRKPIGSWIDSVGLEFGKLLRELGMKRLGINFYALRHVFRTIADETRDQPAVDFIMGHTAAQNDMAARYRERIADERLQAVVSHVRAWLSPKQRKAR